MYSAVREVHTLFVQRDEDAKYVRSKQKRGLPKEITLYQYEVCPFCNKVRAFLDYHKVSFWDLSPLSR